MFPSCFLSVCKKGAVLAAVASILVGSLLYYLENQTVENEERNIRMSEEVSANTASMQALNKSCYVVGYTGEVGKQLVRELLTRKIFQRVVLIGRRKVEYQDELYKDSEQVTVDFDNLDNHADAFKDIDVGFCCLGTTRGKAGKEGFIKVDHDYVMKTAELSKAGGCSHFNLVSSGGANKNSHFLYTKVKGQVEEELKVIGFNRLSIFRPAVLMCDREESRAGEGVLRAVLRPVAYMFPTAISIPTTTVAKAMINNVIATSDKSVELYENKAIHQMGDPKEKK